MATGDVSNPIALSGGNDLTVDIAGLSTGGTYDWGFGANSDPATGSPKVVVTATSLSFDDSGNATTIVRTFYGCSYERKAFSPSGAQLTANESGSSPVTVRFTLTEPIYASDTSITVTILSGFYTQGGTPNNAASGLSVTNNSTLAYPRVCGNLSRPVNDKAGATYRVGVWAFHPHAQQGRPVRVVKGVMADAHGHTATASATVPTYDSTYGDALPVVEYLLDFDTSGFTQGDLGTIDLQWFPWVGDAASVLDTAGTLAGTTAGTSGVSPLYGTRNVICDPNGTYGQGIACVDTTGSDGSGVVSSVLATAAASPFATIGAAITAMRNYNNAGTNNGSTTRNESGGGIIYLGSSGGSQNFAWLGATPTYGAGTMQTFLTIAAYPGQPAANININSYSTALWTGLKIKLHGVTLSASNAGGLFDPNAAGGYVLWDSCVINTTGTVNVWRCRVWDTVRCTVKNNAQGFSTFSTTVTAASILRGNTFTSDISTNFTICAYTVLGNIKTSTRALTFNDTQYGTSPQPTNTIHAYNYWTVAASSAPLIALRQSFGEAHGFVVLQNVFEQTASTSQPCAQFSSDGTVWGDCNNGMICHNTFIGQRVSYAYNEYGATVMNRKNWCIKNNIFDSHGIKTDTFAGIGCSATRSFNTGTVTVTITGYTNHGFNTNDTVYVSAATPSAYAMAGAGSTVTKLSSSSFQYSFASESDPGAITSLTIGPNPGRTGDWSLLFGCMMSGNLFANVTGIGAPGSFQHDFSGIKTDVPTPNRSVQPVSCSQRAASYPGFVNRASYDGSNAGAGGGNYRLSLTSPAKGLQRDWILPFDLDGNPRSAVNDAGPYATLAAARGGTGFGIGSLI